MTRSWVKEAAIYSALRRAYRSAPAVKACLDAGKEVYFIPSKKGKQLRRVRFKCVKCCKAFSRGTIRVDHIVPVVDTRDGNMLENGQRDWNKQIERLFVNQEGLQLLCVPCHNAKSKEENAIRRIRKGLKDARAII